MPRGQGLNNGGVRGAIRVDAVAVTVLTYRARVLVSTAKWPQIVSKKVISGSTVTFISVTTMQGRRHQ